MNCILQYKTWHFVWKLLKALYYYFVEFLISGKQTSDKNLKINLFRIPCIFLIPQKCYISFYRPFRYTGTMFLLHFILWTFPVHRDYVFATFHLIDLSGTQGLFFCYISFYRPFWYTGTMFSESKCLSSLSFPYLASQCSGNKGKIALTSMKKIIKDGKSKFWYLTMRYRLGFRFVVWLLLTPAARTLSIHCVCLFLSVKQ